MINHEKNIVALFDLLLNLDGIKRRVRVSRAIEEIDRFSNIELKGIDKIVSLMDFVFSDERHGRDKSEYLVRLFFPYAYAVVIVDDDYETIKAMIIKERDKQQSRIDNFMER